MLRRSVVPTTRGDASQPGTMAPPQPSPKIALPLLQAVTARTVRTHCPYCAFQCGMMVTTTAGVPAARLAVPPAPEVRPDPEFPVNRGQMCIKGFTSAELLDHPAR